VVIAERFGATDFLPALGDLLRSHRTIGFEGSPLHKLGVLDERVAAR
jgi:hypothetical protein